MDFDILKFELSEGIAVITISRPEAMNALNSAFFREMNLLLNEIEKDEKIKVLIITGEGKAFVAGADISEMAEKNW